MVSLGLKDAGYEYLVVDDGWSELERDANGSLRADSSKFPSGMAALADRVHALGLRFGMYGDAGAKTCGGYPGSRGHEEADAALFAGFGVDYLKYDNCYADPDDPPRGRYEAMRDALNATGRPIVYSLCDWGVAEPWLWAAGVGNSWRTTVDSAPNWRSVMHNLDGNVGLARFARPGAWNDPDMLQVGNGLTPGEQRSHFALWCLLKSPLMISSPLKGLDQAALAVLTAPEVIAVHRDGLGVAGDLIWKQGSKEIHAGPLTDGRRVVVMLNRAHAEERGGARITVRWDQLGYASDAVATVRDLYARRDLGSFRRHFSAMVGPHDCLALVVTPRQQRSGSGNRRVRDGRGAPWDDGWRPWHAQPVYALHDEDFEPAAGAAGAAIL